MHVSPELRPDERFVGAEFFNMHESQDSDRNDKFLLQLAASRTYILTGLLLSTYVMNGKQKH